MNAEWIRANLRDVKPGQKVKIVNGDETLIGPFCIAEAGWVKISRDNGWLNGVKQTGALIWVERARPATPTMHGLYRLSNGMVVELDNMGWRSPNHMQYMEPHVKASYSFQRLMPAPEEAPCYCAICAPASSKSGTESDG